MSAEKYAEYVYLTYLLGSKFDDTAGEKWMSAERMEALFFEAMPAAFEIEGFSVGNRFNQIVDRHITRLYQSGVLIEEGDDLTGRYVSFSIKAKDDVIKAFVNSSEIGARIKRLGQDALSRALNTLADRGEWDRIGEQGSRVQADGGELVLSDIAVPAADRVVRLDHNQISEAETPIAVLVHALEQDNGDPDQPGLRERLLGQIKAGRELIRSGEYRAYLLYEVLVRALGELIRRYKNPAIIALANALLGAVVSNLLQTK